MSDEHEIPDTREIAPTFDALPLSAPVRRALAELGFTHPTPVQLAAFEPSAKGHDMIVQSRTGTGKTLGFGLPLVDRIVQEGQGLQALILAPTRELALQSQRAIDGIGKYTHLQTVAVYGGAPMERQVSALRQGAEIVSGTPGRVLDHIKRGTLDPSTIKVLVLDEADEMFSMGFARELNAIMDALPSQLQYLCFSATIDNNVQRIAERRMHEPQFVALSSDQVGASEISHFYYLVLGDKIAELVRILEVENPESAIIFCNMKSETESVSRALTAAGFDADWLNGDLPQRDREKIMQATREGRLRFMVATDVAARGIDISHLTHVINFGFPESAEQYVHRTGRTGRAGRTGTAISVVGPANLGAFYLLRLTYKIFPIERSLPSQVEIDTRQETDQLDLLTGAFKATPIGEERDLVRRLLTHPDAERVLTGLVRAFLSVPVLPPERTLPPRFVEPYEAEPVEEAEAVDVGDATDKRRKRRKRTRGGEPVAEPAQRVEELVGPVDAIDAREPSVEDLVVSPDLENMTTLYLNVGRRDGLEPGDVSSLLNTSCGLEGDDIGRVRVRERHTFVGVPSERVDGVIAALAGQNLRNRELQVERARA